MLYSEMENIMVIKLLSQILGGAIAPIALDLPLLRGHWQDGNFYAFITTNCVGLSLNNRGNSHCGQWEPRRSLPCKNFFTFVYRTFFVCSECAALPACSVKCVFQIVYSFFPFHFLGLRCFNKTSSSFAASCLRKSPAWSSIPLQRFKLALII